MTHIPTFAFCILLLALLIEIYFLIKTHGKPDPLTPSLLFIAFVLLLATTVYRSIKIDFVAITNMYESLIFFAGAVVAVTVGYRVKFKEKTFPMITFGGTMMAVILLALTSTPKIAPGVAIQAPMPALQSYWLALHVSFAFIGEAFFTMGFITAICFLASKDADKKKRLDKLTYTSIAVGFVFYTVGAMIFGAIWAQYAWGTYWSWDPKETWALITCLTYIIFLHLRLSKKSHGRKTAIISIVAYLFMLFTFFGVNFLLSSLHSYK